MGRTQQTWLVWELGPTTSSEWRMIVHENLETGFTEPAQEQPVCVNVICRSVGLQGSHAIRTIAQLLISIHPRKYTKQRDVFPVCGTNVSPNELMCRYETAHSRFPVFRRWKLSYRWITARRVV